MNPGLESAGGQVDFRDAAGNVVQSQPVVVEPQRSLTVQPPASTAVQVAGLIAPGYLLEVEAWALVDD